MNDSDRFVLDEFTTAAAGRLELVVTALGVRQPDGSVTSDHADVIRQHVVLLADALHRCARSSVETYPSLPRLNDLPPLPR